MMVRRTSGASTGPNVLILLPDQWRGQSTRYMGDTQVRTSAVDRLAAGGAVIERCYATDPLCTPARATLDRTGAAEDTLVVFSSDHGELAGSHGYVGKTRPYEEACLVPSVWRWPGYIPAGVRPDLTCGLVDFAPTLLSLCDLPVPSGVQGTDLSGWLTGRADAPPPQLTYMEGRQEARRARDPEQPQWRAIRTPDHWLTVAVPPDAAQPAVSHLFDMRVDPFQLRNLAGTAAARDLESQLLDTLRQTARRTADPHPALA